MITIERQYFVRPMKIQPNSTLEKIVDKAGNAKAEGRYEEARLLYAEALKEAGKCKDKNKIGVLLSCQMAECLFLSGRTQSAEEQYFQSLEASRTVPGEKYSRSFAPMLGLGYLYLRDERYELAMDKFKLVLAQTLDQKTMDGVKAREGLGLTYAKQGNFPMAHKCFETAVKDIEIELAEDKEDQDEEDPSKDDEYEGHRGTNYANLAYCEYIDGQMEAADKHYAKAEALLGNKLPTECKTVIAILKSHMSLLEMMGRPNEAVKLGDKVKELESRQTTFVKAVDQGDLKGPDFGEYMSKLQKKIKAQWNPPKDIQSNQLVVKFKVYRDGSVQKLALLASTGNPEHDKSGMKAIENAAPFAPLPSKFKRKAVTIQFTFDYNAFHQ